MEVAVVSDEPAHQGEQELAERGVDIEEVGLFEVIRGELEYSEASIRQGPHLPRAGGTGPVWRATHLAEMHFVEHDLIGVANAPETGHKGQGSDGSEGDAVAQFRIRPGGFRGWFDDDIVNIRVGASSSTSLLL